MDVGSKVLGYVIDRKLGEGGMGVVFHAVHPVLGQEVAVKVMDPILARNAEVRERFIQEARIQTTLLHPNIVRVLTADVEGPEPALVMEFVDGLSLERVLERRGPLPLEDAMKVMAQVLSAVGHAHSQGVVHRDLKPANIMVRADGTVRVMDFGIAKILGGARLTRTGTTLGSAHYMAPEQILGRPDMDHRVDIYALGCTFYEVLTGRPPFGHLETGTDSDFLIKQAHVQTAPPDLHTIRPDLPEAISLVILAAMEKNPENRPRTCEELWEKLTVGVETNKASCPRESPPSASKSRSKSTRHSKRARVTPAENRSENSRDHTQVDFSEGRAVASTHGSDHTENAPQCVPIPLGDAHEKKEEPSEPARVSPSPRVRSVFRVHWGYLFCWILFLGLFLLLESSDKLAYSSLSGDVCCLPIGCFHATTQGG